MKTIGQAFHYLSLNIVAGACICSLFIANILESRISPPAVMCLGLTVWIIYTFDHYMDAKQLKVKGKPRHQFHLDHSLFIRIALLIAIAINAILVFSLSQTTLLFGITLFVLVVGYFLLMRVNHQKVAILKELLVAIIYSAGLFAPSIESVITQDIKVSLFLFLLFFLLAWINLLLFSWFDKDYDQREGFLSTVSTLGKRNTKFLILTLLSIYFGTWLYLFIIQSGQMLGQNFLWITLSMGVMLTVIMIRPDLFKGKDRYRLLGDAIFLLPLAVMLGQ